MIDGITFLFLRLPNTIFTFLELYFNSLLSYYTYIENKEIYVKTIVLKTSLINCNYYFFHGNRATLLHTKFEEVITI